MKTNNEQINFEPQKGVSPETHPLDQASLQSGPEANPKTDPGVQENDPLRAEIKRVEVVMLDSESVISPVVTAGETPRSSTPTHNLTTGPGVQNGSRSSLLAGKGQLFAGLLIGFLLASVVLAAFLFIPRREEAEKSGNTNTNLLDTASNEAEPVSGDSTAAETTQQTDEDPPEISKPTSNTSAPSRVKLPNDPRETRTANVVQNQVRDPRDDRPRSLDAADQTQLSNSLDGLIKATNDRNFEQQMIYYAPQVKSYYRARNATPRQIRDEKQKVFGKTESVDIRADRPHISLGQDGRTATMLFRKKYSIRTGQDNRNGEVLHELKWVKTNKGWKIVSERDLKVINR